MSETTASPLPAAPDFLCARLNAARTSPESFDLDGLLGEAVTALGRWGELKIYLDANIRQLRDEAADRANEGSDEMAIRTRREAEVVAMVRAHMGKIEAEVVDTPEGDR